MLNVISVDVEEYFHAANLEPVIGPAKWHAMPSRVEYSTRAILKIFSEHNIRATFFILGSTARRWPSLVKEIAAANHEIASHGYGHRLVYSQTQAQFRRDVYRTKRLLEDIIGSSVFGYRAPNFSITPECPWALETLSECGYVYDSSCYPIRHPRYNNREASTEPVQLRFDERNFYSYPLATYECSSLLRIPVAGGAYWRHFPLWLIIACLRGINQKNKRCFVSYLHPWEIDTEQPRFKELSVLSSLRHYGGTAKLPGKLKTILSSFSFAPLRELIASDYGEEARSAFGLLQKPFIGGRITCSCTDLPNQKTDLTGKSLYKPKVQLTMPFAGNGALYSRKLLGIDHFI